MAILNRPKPDVFQNPVPQAAAPTKALVTTVLDSVAAAGSSIVSLFSGLLAAVLILYSGYVLYDTMYTQNQAFGNSWAMLQYKPEIIEDGANPLDGADKLASINEDYRFWLTLYETNVDYPVVQGPNDLYYASHDIYKNVSLTGSIYLAAGSNSGLTDNYSIVYGHHMDNKAMFGGLDLYKNATYFNNHKEGVIVTSDKVYDLTVFAVVDTDAYESAIYTTGNRDLAALESYIAAHNFQIDTATMAAADKIVALSTCASAETNGRLVVMALLKERDMSKPEDPNAAIVTPPADPDDPVTNPIINPPDDPNGGNTEIIDPPDPPLIDRLLIPFTPPEKTMYGEKCWAVINLAAVIFTAYLVIPVMHLRDKYGRGKLMMKINQRKEELRNLQEEKMLDIEKKQLAIIEEMIAMGSTEEDAKAAAAKATGETYSEAVEKLFYQVRRFIARFRMGLSVEIVDLVLIVIIFVLTEDITTPMVLIDEYTPLMVLLAAVCWIIDVRMLRYREKALEGEEQALKDQIKALESAQAAAGTAK